jgi:hypothetical protein
LITVGVVLISGATTFSVKDAKAVCAGVLESVTWNVIKDPDIASGVPLIAPVDESSAAHDGNLPAVTFHVYGPVPPVAVSVCEYGTPNTPSLSAGVVIVTGPVCGGAMVSLKDAVALCAGVPESVTLNVSGVAVTGAGGVPLIPPVAGFNVKPNGSVPAVNCQE